jgi:aspartate racemase
MSDNLQSQLSVGVLGGLGPEATVDFMAKIVAATPAESDQDHIHLLIDHNPKVPNRHAAIAGETPSVGPNLAVMAQRLETAGADFLVMTCNTAHAYSDDIRNAVDIPFISIIDTVIESVIASSCQSVGVMAASGCLKAGLYQRALADAGIDTILWNAEEIDQFMELVYRIKAGDRDPEIGRDIEKLAASMAFSGADTLISGCTEIPLFLNASNSPLPLLSSTDLLVQRTIALARRELVLEN